MARQPLRAIGRTRVKVRAPSPAGSAMRASAEAVSSKKETRPAARSALAVRTLATAMRPDGMLQYSLFASAPCCQVTTGSTTLRYSCEMRRPLCSSANYIRARRRADAADGSHGATGHGEAFHRLAVGRRASCEQVGRRAQRRQRPLLVEAPFAALLDPGAQHQGIPAVEHVGQPPGDARHGLDADLLGQRDAVRLQGAVGVVRADRDEVLAGVQEQQRLGLARGSAPTTCTVSSWLNWLAPTR